MLEAQPASVRIAATLLAMFATDEVAVAQWQQQSPTTTPAARRGAAMTYATGIDRVVMFGGTGNPLPNDETWTYDGSGWTLLAPPTRPSARQEVEMVYDPVRDVTVLHGGFSAATGGANAETWEFDGSTWTQQVTATSTGGLYRNGISYDLVRQRVVLYGGVASGVGAPSNKTWEYDGSDWTQVTTAATPGPLDRPAMCYHAGIARTVLFGGAFGSTQSDATWVYDGTAWTQAPITGSKPAARNAAKMVYDPARGVCVMTGGQDANTIYADTWEFDGSTWTQQPTATQPARDHSLAFLISQRQVVKFGGFAMAPNTLTDQTWHFGARWRVFGNGCAGSAGVPTLSMPDAGRIGGAFTLDLASLNPAPLLAVVVLGLTELPGVPLDFLGMTGCLGFTTPDVLVNLATNGGTASYTWSPVFGAIDDRIFAQALCLDPGVNPGWLTASNAVATTLGL